MMNMKLLTVVTPPSIYHFLRQKSSALRKKLAPLCGMYELVTPQYLCHLMPSFPLNTMQHLRL